MAIQSTRYTLNRSQFHLLRLLYKFQYITIPLLTTYKNLKSNSLQRNLNILVDKGYITKQYSAKDKIDRKPAIYYLNKTGITALRGGSRLDTRQLNTYYKNGILSDEYKQRCIDTLAVYNIIRAVYPETFDLFTRQEIAHSIPLPATKPDMYLRGNASYFLILAHTLQPYIARKQLREYITHFDEEGSDYGDDYPHLLFVLRNDMRQQAFLKYAENMMESTGIRHDELYVGVTTFDKLNAMSQNKTIWSFTGESRSLKSLNE